MGKFLAGNKAGKRFTKEYNVLKSVINDYKSGKVGWGYSVAQSPVRAVDKGKRCYCVQGAIASKLNCWSWDSGPVIDFCIRAGLTTAEGKDMHGKAWYRNDSLARPELCKVTFATTDDEKFAEFIAWLESCLPNLMRAA